MDNHTQRGSHWVACYMGLNPRVPQRYGIWYYDSVARPAPPEIAQFMQRMHAEVQQAHLPAAARFQLRSNRVRKQYQNTECGIYACAFLIACVTTPLPFDTICQHVMEPDATTRKLRRVLFR